MKIQEFPFKYTKICWWESNNQQTSVGSDNGLVTIKQQAIIWASDGLAYRCIYASLSLNDLSQNLFQIWKSLLGLYKSSQSDDLLLTKRPNMYENNKITCFENLVGLQL